LPLGAILLSGAVIFHMGAEGEFVAVSVAAGAVSLTLALVLTRNITGPLERVRHASVRLAEGELDERAPVRGPTEIAGLARSFNAMAERLESVFDARRELIAWASHDLRAPITSLQAMLEAIDDGVIEFAHYMEPLQSQVRLLGSLIDDLFEMACIDAGATTIEMSPVDMVDLVWSCARRFELEARARGIELVTVIRDEDVVAHCAADKVERVMTNLVTNALRYTPAGGKMALSLTKGADAVFVSVEDTGSGIASDSMERVFEPFFRADISRSPADGSAGLGLAIARGLIDAQGGRIWAEAPTAGGARICFVLPAHDLQDRTSPHHETDAGSHRGDGVVSLWRDRRALER
ncbi:MAG TPA: ATP-binding protein, partial [Acidimicrobiales bacterium]|nr:ATP-binding protein [Acidimicrobiales bacterium]